MKVLREGGMPPRKAEKLIAEVLTGIHLRSPNPDLIRRLRKPLSTARKAICRGPEKGWGRVLRWTTVVSHGVVALGGVGVIVINGASLTMTLGMAYGSIVTGANIAVSRLEAIDKILRES